MMDRAPGRFRLLLGRMAPRVRDRTAQSEMGTKLEFLGIVQIACVQRLVQRVKQAISFTDIQVEKVGSGEEANS